MTPYEIDILLHYYCRASDHPDVISNPPIWRPTITRFQTEALLETDETRAKAYRITPRGEAYCRALQQVPLPTSTWTVKWPN